LPMLDEARRSNHKAMNEIFKPYESFFHLPVATDKADPCWFAYLLTIRDDAPFSRDDIVRHLEKDRIQTRSYFSGNILYHPGYQYLAEPYGDLHERFPVSKRVTMNSFFLGTFAGITAEHLEYIKNSVDSFMGGLDS